MSGSDPLRTLLRKTAEAAARQKPPGDGGDPKYVRASVIEAADILRAAYGERALAQARRMEKTASDPLFAKLVRRELENGSGT